MSKYVFKFLFVYLTVRFCFSSAFFVCFCFVVVILDSNMFYLRLGECCVWSKGDYNYFPWETRTRWHSCRDCFVRRCCLKRNISGDVDTTNSNCNYGPLYELGHGGSRDRKRGWVLYSHGDVFLLS